MRRPRRISKLLGGMVGLALLSLATANVANAALIFNDRPTFEAALGTFIVDDYSNPGYLMGDDLDLPTFDIHSDNNMSAIVGETQYTSTGFPDNNFITGQSSGDPFYCAGCNGSYLLDFTSTSVGTAQGVFGVGLDIEGIAENVFGTTAFVTFGDGSTGNFMIPESVDAFWGITDALLISSIHFGLMDGGTNTDNSVQRMAHDNLTIGPRLTAVPEPATLWSFALGLVGLAVLARRRRFEDRRS